MRYLLIFIGYFLLSQHAVAQFQFNDAFDNGRLDSTYWGGDAHVLAPIVNLHVQVTGVKDSTPRFKIYDFEGYRLRNYHRMVYRYSQDSAWYFFDQGNKAGSVNYYYFQNNTPFLYDTVYIAYWYPWTWQNQQDYIQQINGSSQHIRNVYPRGYSYENRPLWGYEITDTAVTDCYKQKVVITARQHPTEHINGYFVRGLTNYLLYTQDSISDYLRAHYRFFIYPMLNPDGVFHGIGQNLLGQGLNRDWNPGLSPGGCPEIDSIKSYIWAETNGHADFSIDIHSNPGSNLRYYWWGINGSSGLDADSVARALEYVESVAQQDALGGQGLFQNFIQGNGINGSYTAGNWFFNTLGAHAFTFEPTSEPISMTTDLIPASRMESAGSSLVKGFWNLFRGTEPLVVQLRTDSLKAWVELSGGQQPYQIQWDDPAMQQGDTLQGAGMGTYHVHVTDAGGCSWKGTVFLMGNTSLSEPSNLDFRLYPNPASKEVWLELATSATGMLWDIQGKLQKRWRDLPKGKHRLDLAEFAAGIYWIEVVLDGKRKIRPISLLKP